MYGVIILWRNGINNFYNCKKDICKGRNDFLTLVISILYTLYICSDNSCLNYYRYRMLWYPECFKTPLTLFFAAQKYIYYEFTIIYIQFFFK